MSWTRRRRRTPHRRRQRFEKPSAVVLTTRMCPHVCNLREPKAIQRIEQCIERARDRFNTQIIHYDVLGNHYHLIGESDDCESLSSAMKGLNVRIAKSLNDLMGTRGQVIDHRYHSSVVRSLRGARRVMRYVRENYRRHFGPPDEWRTGVTIDPCSSWANRIDLPLPRTLLQFVDPFG